MSLPLEPILQKINEDGYIIIENILSKDFISKAKAELQVAIEKEVAYHNSNTNYNDYGSLCGGAFLELFENNKLIDVFNTVLGEGCIVYAYTSSSMPPNKTNYSNRIHVDSPRLIPNYITNMGATILLDDFTIENGATWFLPKSQNNLEAPDDEFFYKQGKRVIAPAGSVFFFNARLWHAGGNNSTQHWRHALTINMCRPYMKQRIDIPKAMENMNIDMISEVAKQKLGFYAQVPANYDEYYVPYEKRKYKQITE